MGEIQQRMTISEGWAKLDTAEHQTLIQKYSNLQKCPAVFKRIICRFTLWKLKKQSCFIDSNLSLMTLGKLLHGFMGHLAMKQRFLM